MIDQEQELCWEEADRIEQLAATCEELVKERDENDALATKYMDLSEALRDNLAKAVEALRKCLDYFEQIEKDFGPLHCGDIVRAVLAELEGQG